MKPLVTHQQLTDVLAYRHGCAVSVAQYLADVAYCVKQLPQSKYVLLACQDRYAFAVGFGAAMIRQQTCLLPSTHTEELVAKLASTHKDLYCLTDELTCAINLPQTYMGDVFFASPVLADASIPMIPEVQIAALVFTSGSTGLPVPHVKTWGKLVINVQNEGKRLGVIPGSGYTMIGTVPPQHMYGFESTVLIALQNAAVFESSKPFYPADIEQVLQRTPRPRALVTTPFHLRAYLAEIENPGALELLVSATAPLKASLALLAEQKTHAKLLEIYGSTETGQLATRRTTQTYDWQTFEGIVIEQVENTFFATGAQIEGRVAINDVLELKTECVFVLHGRTVDMVNVAGKSTTLGYLNHQLLSISGVDDGAYFMQTDEADGVGNTARLAALVVAPSHTHESLVTELRRKVAPAFLPRPLKIVPDLPRNATGKLPREVLLRIMKSTPGS